MDADKRKERRRPLRYSAWMAIDGDKLHGCVLSNISDGGARLDVDDPQAMPEQFMLVLSGTSGARRRCRVIWRGPGQVGVAFESHLNAVRKPAPKAAADATARTGDEPQSAVPKVAETT